MPHIVITGITHGIGKAIAHAFLEAGFDISGCARNIEEIQQCAEEWKKTYDKQKIQLIPCDLSKPSEVETFAERVKAAFPTVDILINNAGIFLPGKLMDEPDGHLESLLSVNLLSAYKLTRHLLPALTGSQKAHIFNISSVAGQRAYENGGSYSITKYALTGFSENLRHELMTQKIRVTTVFPGATWSRSWAFSGLPESRFISAEDIAAMILATYRLSPSANVDTLTIRPLQGDI